jgi:hypothetical protein
VTGSQQDSGSAAVLTRSNHAEISNRDWEPACAGGESGYTAPDPLHPNILFGGTVTRCNVVTGEVVNVSPERSMTVPARHTWTLPLVFSEADPRALYFSNQFLFKTINGGESWTQISQDMTREDPGTPPNLDEPTAKDAPADKRRGVIYSIAPSPLRASTVWIGTDDGLIHKTDDDGKTWVNVTPPELTPWSKVVMLIASHFDVNEAFAAIDSESVDYAVMENTARAAMVPADMAWSDIGNWQALHAARPRDDAGNATAGPVELVDCRNVLVDSDGPRVSVIGLEDVIIVVDGNDVLVTTAAGAQKVGKLGGAVNQ